MPYPINQSWREQIELNWCARWLMGYGIKISIPRPSQWRHRSPRFWCTKETKLIEFQFKSLHRRITTNDFLYKIGIKQSDSCSFCEEVTENLVHLFWSCKYSNAFWKDDIMQNTSKVEKFNRSEALLFGWINDAKDLLLHHLLFIARHYIYICKQEIRFQMSKCKYK